MNSTHPESNAKKSIFFRVISNPWLVSFIEVIAFVLLIFKLFPASWTASEWPFLVLIGLALIGLLISNYKLAIKYPKLLAENELRSNGEISNINKKYKSQIALLDEENKRLEKKARYADVLPVLNGAFQDLHNAIRRDHTDKKMYREYFEKFCQSLEIVFNKVTGVDCHVCIKMTIFPKDQLPSSQPTQKNFLNFKVKTYCRSLHLSYDRIQSDSANYSHLITENTDFESIFRKGDSCYICNNLVSLSVYRNSSFKRLTNGRNVFFDENDSYEKKVKEWPLKYKSTIVAPILPIVKETREDHIILGLLCVDSNTPEVFDEELDKHIMVGCADGIYNSFKKLFISPK